MPTLTATTINDQNNRRNRLIHRGVRLEGISPPTTTTPTTTRGNEKKEGDTPAIFGAPGPSAWAKEGVSVPTAATAAAVMLVSEVRTAERGVLGTKRDGIALREKGERNLCWT